MTDVRRLRELEEWPGRAELSPPPDKQLQVEKTWDQAPDVSSHDERHLLLDRVQVRRNDLHEAMVRLEACVAGAAQREGWIESVHMALLTLRSAIDAHIREVEMPDGLLTEVSEVAPRLAPDIERVRSEHEGLVRGCEDVLERTKSDGASTSEEISRRVTRLLGRLAIHRQHGSRLMYDAYNFDVGGMG